MALAVAVATAVLLADGVAVGQSAREERERVQTERAEAARQVEVLDASDEQIRARLAEIDAELNANEAAAEAATRAARAGEAEALAAREAAAESQAELGALQDRLKDRAVTAYMDPPGDALARRLEAESAQQDATRQALLDVRTGQDVDLADRLRVVRRRHEDALARAEAAQRAAEEAKAAADSTVERLRSTRSEQEAYASSVRSRLDQRLADVAALSRIDAKLAERIRAEEAAVAAALRALAPPAPTPAAGGPGPSAGPGGQVPSGGTSARPRPPTPTPPLRTVGGITVHADIADSLRAMLDAAAADGIDLGGSGYRDIQSQIALRRQHCGTSDHAVHDMPPDMCSPPTARPGLSMHERGLAVDFTANGRSITSRSDPGFVWLSASASRFGFRNLPSEPWHWSTTGS